MILADVNVLVYAHRADAPNHRAMKVWLESVINDSQAYGMSDLVLSSFLRIVTHPAVFSPPSTMDDALAFCGEVRDQPHCVHIAPGPRHWDIFIELCAIPGIKGNLVPDAYLAALALESGSEWITTDRDYSRFPKLRWRHPLDKLRPKV
jgi:toxin-antitoxin system PIN domain toxin